MADGSANRPASRIPGRGSYEEALRIGEILRKEAVGGILLVITAAAALIWANSPASAGYFALRDFRFGYEPWHLELSLGAWAADGLLAIFFFLVGLELKKEFVAGDLRSINRAVVPVAAAVGGVAVPALVLDLYSGMDLYKGTNHILTRAAKGDRSCWFSSAGELLHRFSWGVRPVT